MMQKISEKNREEEQIVAKYDENISCGTVLEQRAGRLRKFLKLKKLRQSELRHIGLGISSIHQYVHGKTRLPNYVIHLLERVYGLDHRWINSGEGNMFLEKYEQEGNIRLKDDIITSLKITKGIPKQEIPARLKEQGLRLQKFLKYLKLRQSHLTTIGISSSMSSQYLHGRVRIPSYIISLLIFVYNLNPYWLVNGEGEMHLLEEDLFVKEPSFASNRLLESREKNALRPIRHLGVVAAGKPVPLPDDWDGSYSWVNESLVARDRHEEYYTLTVKGKSMIDAGIYDNDQVVIRHQNNVDHGQIAVVSIDDYATLKQIFINKDRGVIELRPCNKSMGSIIIKFSEKPELKVHGVCVGLMRGR